MARNLPDGFFNSSKGTRVRRFSDWLLSWRNPASNNNIITGMMKTSFTITLSFKAPSRGLSPAQPLCCRSPPIVDEADPAQCAFPRVVLPSRAVTRAAAATTISQFCGTIEKNPRAFLGRMFRLKIYSPFSRMERRRLCVSHAPVSRLEMPTWAEQESTGWCHACKSAAG